MPPNFFTESSDSLCRIPKADPSRPRTALGMTATMRARQAKRDPSSAPGVLGMTARHVNARSGFPAKLTRSFKHLLFAGHSGILERRREGNRHVHRSDSLHRSIQIVKSAFRDHRGDFRSHSVTMVAFIDHYGARSFLGGFYQSFFVERPRRARIDDLGADSDVLEQFRRAQGNL